MYSLYIEAIRLQKEKGNHMNIKTVGLSTMAGSFVSEVKGKYLNEGFGAAWDYIPEASGYEFQEIPIEPNYQEGNRGIYFNNSGTVCKFLIKGE